MADPTQKQQLDAAWSRLKVWNNISMPVLFARLRNIVSRLG